jgi:hypothetical protein
VKPCVAHTLGYLMNMLDGFVIDIEPCDQPRTHRVLISRTVEDGLKVEATAELCTEHEAVLDGTGQMVRSWPIRPAVLNEQGRRA